MGKTSDNAMVITLPKGSHVEMDNGAIRIVYKPEVSDDFEARFPVIPASKLSLNDKFMKHVPVTESQEYLMIQLQRIIKEGIEDFRVSAIDPSFNNNDEIVFKAGLRPAIGKYSYWWDKKLKEFMPDKRSRMGTKTEYLAFCGYIIKYLVSNGWKLATAWRAVCDESKALGHYRDSSKAKCYMEPTGSRRIGVFYDLANTCKILKNDKDEDFSAHYVRTNTIYTNLSNVSSLINLQNVCCSCYVHAYSVGWIVMDV